MNDEVKHEDENAMTAVEDAPADEAAEAIADAPATVDAPPESGIASVADALAAPAESGIAAVADAVAEAPAAPVMPVTPPPPKRRWYVVKVQSGREESIRNALDRRIKIDNLEEFIGRILIPTEKVTELRNGKRVIKKRKKFPGYLMCEVEFNDRVLYLFRETSGVGDFVGGSLTKLPTPMTDREVERMLLEEQEAGAGKKGGDEPTKKKIIIPYAVGDRVKVRDGTFKDMEGEVKEITDPPDAKENPKVKVVLTIWGRPVDVDVEYWQVDPV